MDGVWLSLKGTFVDKVIEIGVRLLAAGLILLVGIWLIKKLLRLVQDAKQLQHLTPSERSFLHSLLRIGLKCLLAALVVTTLGVPMASIVALIGSVGLAIGLALQGALQNVAGGLIIMIFKPFAVNDYVTVGQYSGTVTEIGIFYTVLTTSDNCKVVVPNAQITNKEMRNSVSGSLRRVDIQIAAPYDVRAEEVFLALSRAAAETPGVLAEPAPSCVLSGYADSAVEYQVFVWCSDADVRSVRFALNEAVKRVFDESGISFPFPQLDVHIGGPGRAQ